MGGLSEKTDMIDQAGAASAPVAVISGGGLLPMQVVESIEARGGKAYVIAIRNEACEAILRRADIVLGWGQIGKLFSSMKRAGCRQVVLIGGVSRRPDFTSILGDPGTLMRLPRILRAMLGGDDSLLVKVIGIFEGEGFQVVGAKDVAPEILVGAGALGQVTPSADALEDLRLACEATKLLGALDIGQAAVAIKGRVVALEGAEGTDLMLKRCVDLRALGRIKTPSGVGVLVKTVKPQQDKRVDLPAIGPATVENLVEAGLAGVAVEAGGAVLAEPEKTVQLANKASVFIYGFDPVFDPK